MNDGLRGGHILSLYTSPCTGLGTGPLEDPQRQGCRGSFVEEPIPGRGSAGACSPEDPRPESGRRYGYRLRSVIWPDAFTMEVGARDGGACTRLTLMSIESDPSEDEARRRDLDLVRRSLRGEEGSIDGLAARLSCVPRILASINHRLGGRLDDHDLADLSQDALLIIWGKLDSYEGRGKLETWAYRFCLLEYMNRVRRNDRRARVDRAPIEALDAIPAPEEPVMREHELLEIGLDELGPPEAEVIRMKHFDEQTFEDIGDVLDLSPSTVKSRYYRGLAWLRDRLAPLRRKEIR